MKKLLFLLPFLFFAACTGEAESTPVEQQEYVPAMVVDVTPAVNETEPETVLDVFYFNFMGHTLHLNQDMEDVFVFLGEPLGMRQTPSCAFDGYDKIFGFGAINVHTYPQGDQDFVQVISIRDDSVTTVNGIRLGDSLDDVIAAYGNDFTQDFNMYIFTKNDTTLSFFIEGDMVVEITYTLILE